MTAAQSIKFYNLFRHQLQIDEANAKAFLEVVEEIVDSKLEQKNEVFVKKNEVERVEHQVELLRVENKAIIAEFRTEMEKRFNQIILWIVSTGIAVIGIIIAFIKLK